MAPEGERAQVLTLLKRHGRDATSFQTLEPGFRYWFAGADACVAYVETGSSWVAAGAPIAAPTRVAATAAAFVGAARAARRRAAFFATEPSFVADTPSLRALAIGEQPVWEPAAWPDTLSRTASLRAQLRRARAKGVSVRRVALEELTRASHDTRRQIEALIVRWRTRHALPPMGFLVQVHAFSHPRERLCFVAERESRIVGFLAAVPVYARSGWLFENLLRDPAAPSGTNELLFDAAMRTVAADGSDYATLGLAPLAGAVPWWLRLARAAAAGLYDFEGLAAFKAKLRPTRSAPLFLSYVPEHGALRTVLDALRVFARGRLLSFGVEALVRASRRREELVSLSPRRVIVSLSPSGASPL
jgi:phosphatidylglycerol lysyltransferase